MAGKARWSPIRRRQVGIAVAIARQCGIEWKVLERIYGHSRRQLLRLADDATALMSQHAALMSHRSDGPGAAASGTVSGIDTTLIGDCSMGGGGSPPPPQAPPAAPTLSDPAVSNAARAEQLTAARARGRASTILTGGLGLMTPAPVQQKTLLGQ